MDLLQSLKFLNIYSNVSHFRLYYLQRTLKNEKHRSTMSIVAMLHRHRQEGFFFPQIESSICKVIFPLKDKKQIVIFESYIKSESVELGVNRILTFMQYVQQLP